MSDGRRYLLGQGERLTGPVSVSHGMNPPKPPYSREEAIARLCPQVADLSQTLDALPSNACPNDEAVATLTLHPQALAKSYHPKRLLQQYDLRQVGSRPVDICPEKWTRKADPEQSQSTELYVAGSREHFGRWSDDFVSHPQKIDESIQRVERISPPSPHERLRNLDRAERTSDGLLVELILHARVEDSYVISALADYTEFLGVDALLRKRVQVGGLCFIPAEVPYDRLNELASFAFLRVVRPAAKLRRTLSVERAFPMPTNESCSLPGAEPVNGDLRVAVFDGGLPEATPLSTWVRCPDLPDTGASVSAFQSHGHNVTSALLFGSLEPNAKVAPPFTTVDHYRVLDHSSDENPFELYDVLQRIDRVLSSSAYDFVNLSIGPDVPFVEDDIHPWTAILDSHLADGQTLATIAVGNNGENADPDEQRVQVPADCVNALSVGAADSTGEKWARASYSAIGPGRAPGYVKPDILDFGGTLTHPFRVAGPAEEARIGHVCGTSFASPSVLRRAVALRTHFGERLTPLGIRALLVHTAETKTHECSEVGWGRVSQNLQDIMVCGDNQVRVLYQGKLDPGKYLRARVPLPDEELQGKVTIDATFTFATETDPEDPGNYSRAGLEIFFRPHDMKFESEDSAHPKTDPFFRRAVMDPENVLRRDAQKWETTLNASKSKQGKSLHKPVFDIHYIARENGGESNATDPIPYALVVTVEAPQEPGLYDRVLRSYSTELEALQPVLELPIRF